MCIYLVKDMVSGLRLLSLALIDVTLRSYDSNMGKKKLEIIC